MLSLLEDCGKVEKGSGGSQAPPVCLLCGVQGVAMEAVSREVTDVLWDSHHTNGVWFSLWVVLYPVI